jgi:hypothetical protein
MKTPLDVLSMITMCVDSVIKQGKDRYSASGNKLGELVVDAQVIGNQIIGQLITGTTGAREVTNLHDILAGRVPGIKGLSEIFGDAIVKRREPKNDEEILAQFIGDFGSFILGDKIMTALNNEEAVGGQIISVTVGLLCIEILRRLGKNTGIRMVPYISPYLTTEAIHPQTQAEHQAKNLGKAASFLLCAYGITITSFAPVVPPLVAGGLGYKLLTPLAANTAVLVTRATSTLYSYCYSAVLGTKGWLDQLFVEQKTIAEKKNSYSRVLIFSNQDDAYRHLLGHGVGLRNPNVLR